MRGIFTYILVFLFSFLQSATPACDSIKIKALTEEAQKVISVDVQKATELAKRALTLGLNCTEQYNRFDPVLLLSRCYLRSGLSDSVINLISAQLNNKSLSINSFYKAKLNQAISSAYIKLADYDKGLSACLTAMKYFEELHDSLNYAKMLINSANVYQQLNSPGLAEKNLRSAEKIAYRLINNLKLIGEVNNALGILYAEQNKADSAETFFLKSISAREELNDKTNLGWNYNNLGGLYALGLKKQKAVVFLEKAFLVFTENGDNAGLASVTNNLGSVYKDLGQYKKALHYFGLARVYNENNNDNLENLFTNLADLHKQLNNFNSAFLYSDSLNKLKDTLYGKKLTEHLAEMHAKYESEKKENDLKLKTTELENQKQKSFYTILLLSALSVLIAIVSLAFYFIYKNRQKNILQAELLKKEAEHFALGIATLEKERNRIAEELHDNTGALVSFIVTKSDWLIQNTNAQNNELKDIKSAASEAMGSLRETLWTLNNKTITNLNLTDKLKVYIKKHLVCKTTITEEAVEELILPNDVVLALYRCVQEIVNNINKHSGATEVKVLFMHAGRRRFSVCFVDNGVGINYDLKNENYGIRNMKNRMFNIGADLAITRNPDIGTTAEIVY